MPVAFDHRQIDLEDWLEGRHRNRDPRTSRRAAKSVNAPRISKEIVRLLATVGALTTEEMARLLKRNLQSVTPRMVPLSERGLVRRTERTRRGSSGRERILWEYVAPEAPPTSPG